MLKIDPSAITRLPTQKVKPMKNVLFSFPDDVARDKFLTLMKTMYTSMLEDNDVQMKNDGAIIKSALGTIRLDPPIRADHERIVALYVSGQKMVEGTLADMRKRFQQEVDSHSANVSLKELRDGSWVEIQARRLQR